MEILPSPLYKSQTPYQTMGSLQNQYSPQTQAQYQTMDFEPNSLPRMLYTPPPAQMQMPMDTPPQVQAPSVLPNLSTLFSNDPSNPNPLSSLDPNVLNMLKIVGGMGVAYALYKGAQYGAKNPLTTLTAVSTIAPHMTNLLSSKSILAFGGKGQKKKKRPTKKTKKTTKRINK